MKAPINGQYNGAVQTKGVSGMRRQGPRIVNEQVPVVANKSTTSLNIHSIFATLQGEGPYAGVPCVFVRFAGCNLQCVRCDTAYTGGLGPMGLEDVVTAVHKARGRDQFDLVVITGGEPLLQQALAPFCKLLNLHGYRVQIESNGSLPVPQDLPADPEKVFLLVSPKSHHVAKSSARRADAYKYVMGDEPLGDDGLPNVALEGQPKKGKAEQPPLARPPSDFPADKIYIQTQHDGTDADAFVQDRVRLGRAIETCKRHNYRISLQTHRIMNLP